MPTPAEELALALAKLDPRSAKFATDAVDLMLQSARAADATDLHLQPTPEGLDALWRVDGVLASIALLPSSAAPNVVARLKVLANLLTYRNDVPQEGRIRDAPGNVETRVSTFPTLYGERAVVRNFPGAAKLSRLGELGLEPGVLAALEGLLSETSGALVVSGPSGSGKTTTVYACLREIVERSKGGRSLMTLEDPIEAAVAGVSQSQVNEHSGFDLEGGLRSLLRQDPEVIVVGEIRDKATAEITLQAALTGHLVLTTFHAGSAAGAISRLSEMGMEPYVLRSGLLAILSQRLLRKLCTCAAPADASDPRVHLGLELQTAKTAVGCQRCGSTGYSGRFPIAELVLPRNPAVSKAVLAKTDLDALAKVIGESGVVTLWDRAKAAIEAGATTPAEARRVLGFQTNLG